MPEQIAFLKNKQMKSILRVLRVALIVACATAIISVFLPNYYLSDARLLPQESQGSKGLGNLAAAAMAFGIGIGGGGGDANFVDILNSRWIGDELLKSEFTFSERAWRFGAPKARRTTLYQYLEGKNPDRALKALRGLYGASKDVKTNVIYLYAETKSPELSQQIVQRAIDLLNQFQVQRSRTRGSEKAVFSEARLKEARQEMEDAEKGLRTFLEVNRNYQTSADPAIRLRGMRLETEFSLRRQLITTLAINREQALLDAKNDIPVINVLDPGNLPVEKSRPSRSTLVLFAGLLAGLATWVHLNWVWVKSRLFTNFDQDPPLAPIAS